MEIGFVILTVFVSFFIGSIPTGYILVKKFYGIDIRALGSGNIGSTNVKRIVGTKVSIMTQIIDILKGVIPIVLAITITRKTQVYIAEDIFYSIVALAAIFGHNYTPFLSFKGGKGVNTTLGAFVLIAPVAVFSGVAVYLALRFFTKIVSIRSISLGITIPVVCVISGLSSSVIIATSIAAILMVYRHKSNLVRFAKHEEK